MIERHSKARVPDLEVYTDGSLKKMGQSMTFGGWAFIVLRNNQKIYAAAGSEPNTTNQRMELQAICEALKYVSDIRRPHEKVGIYSDSAYAINCYLQDWYVKWQANGWRNSSNHDVANQDLWVQIIPFFDHFWYDFHKVEGHSDSYWNIECDELAQKSAEHLKKYWKRNEVI